jgi:hypothetical protein
VKRNLANSDAVHPGWPCHPKLRARPGSRPRHFADGRFGTRQQVDTLFGYPLPLAQLFGQYFFDAVDAVVLGNKLRTGNHACA